MIYIGRFVEVKNVYFIIDVITDVYKKNPNFNFIFLGFGQEQSKIDYIFLSSELNEAAKPAKAWDETFNTIFLSDHYPIEVEL